MGKVNRLCPGNCGRRVGADLLCGACMSHLSTDARRHLGDTWRRWVHTGSLAAMEEYESAVAVVIREAERWNELRAGAPRLPRPDR